MEDFQNDQEEFEKKINKDELINSPYQCPDSRNLNLKHFLPYLLDMTPDEVDQKPIRPSTIVKELLLSTEERMKKLKNPLRKFKNNKSTDPFAVCPEALIFQRFEKGKFYDASILITNRAQVPQNLVIEFAKSMHFSISSKNHRTRLAAGMSYTVVVTFSPCEQNKNYTYEIRFKSEKWVFTVPIFAMGPRPIINMPDKVVVPPTVVRVPSEVTLLLKNSGDSSSWFAWDIEPPFWVSNEKMIFTAGTAHETRVVCNSSKAGHMVSNMRTLCDDQYYLTTTFECEVFTASIFLEKQTLTFDNIFMGLVCARNVTLHNRSKFTLNYRWKLYDLEREKKEISQMLGLLGDMKDYETIRDEKLEYMGIIDHEDHQQVYERIYDDEKQELTNKIEEKLRFNHTNFQIIPVCGKIIPNSSNDFAIHFAPTKNTFYHVTAHLDIDGVEKRLRMDLHGNGVGPDVVFSTNCLQAEMVYLTEKHQYEIVCKNKGSIPANVRYVPHPSEFGGNISCLPEMSRIKPDSVKPFVILFYSEIEGNFLENLEFEILESGDILKCAIAGNVVCPLLKPTPNTLNYGKVSVGIDNELSFVLKNETPVSTSFDIETPIIPNDCGKITKNVTIEPIEGTVDAHLEQAVKVTINCLSECLLKTNLMINMWNGKHTLIVPLECNCVFPNILCEPTEITIPFGFIGCQYKKTICFKNLTELPGRIEFVPEKDGENKSIFCDAEPSKIFLNGKESAQVELTIYTESLGPQELPLLFNVGGGAIRQFCTIHLNGQGPVIAFSPDVIDFGNITALETFQKTLTLSNHAPIPARVTVCLKLQTMFFLKENEFEIEPEQDRDVIVFACLNTASTVTDTLILEIQMGDKISLNVTATGVGSCIQCEPRLNPSYDLGTILTYSKFSFPVKVMNKGTIVHRILISPRQNVKVLKPVEDENVGRVFSIKPISFKLEVGEDIAVNIEGSMNKPEKVEEKFYFYALLGKSNVVQTLFDFVLKAQFADPQLGMNKSSLYFQQNIMGDQVNGKVTDKVFLNNLAGLEFDIILTTDVDHFQILDDIEAVNGTHQRTVRHNQSFVTEIGFNPVLFEKRKKELTGRLFVDYVDHPKTDIIDLHGEVMYPTIRLLPNQVNFGSIPNASTTVRTIVIHNISNMEVFFTWKWLKESLVVNSLPSKKKVKLLPVTLNKAEFTTEEDLQKQKELLLSDITAPTDSENLTKVSTTALFLYDNDRYSYEMKKLLCPILNFELSEDEDELREQDYPNFILKPCEEQSVNEFSKYLDLVPAEGTIAGGVYTTISVGFHPPPDTEVSALAICKVLGGEEEILTLTGQSTHCSYKLDKQTVEFGNQVFCEECSSELTLKNDGLCSFNYSIILPDNTPLKHFEPGMVEVVPKTKTLETQGFTTLSLKYYPGYLGEFWKKIVLEVDYLEPLTINLHGYSVLSQVYLTVPRPELHNDTYLSYEALSALTSDYLQGLDKSLKKCADNISDQTHFLKDNDWEVVLYNVFYPEIMDIDLCIERKIASRHIRKNIGIFKNHTIIKKLPYIPELYVPAYLVDFGYVVKDKPVCYTIVIFNYGPIKTDVKILENKKSTLHRNEFKIELPNKVLSLNINEIGQCYVLFTPTGKRYTKQNEKVEDEFHLTVKHGPIVPVKIKATVTVPKVQFNHNSLDFGKIYCGECLRRTIVLTNSEAVPAKWYAHFPTSTIKGQKPPFSFTPIKGDLNPTQQCFLNIYFIPKTEGPKRSFIKFNVEHSTEEVTLELTGDSSSVKLEVKMPELNFAPTLSSFKSQTEFFVRNVSDKSVEFYFPEFDEEIELEKNVTQVYLKYKNLKKLFVPHMTAGQRLPADFKNLYYSLLTKLKQKMTAPSSDKFLPAISNKKENLEIQRTEEDVLDKYLPHETYDILMSYIDAEGFDIEPDLPFPTKATTSYEFDDKEDFTEIIEPESQPDREPVERIAAILIFHGSPMTDYYKAANDAGFTLNFPVYSIDRLIIEGLLETVNSSSETILNNINSHFEEVANQENVIKIELEELEYDKLLEKVNTILLHKLKKGKKGSQKGKDSPRKDKDSSRSKASSKAASEKTDKGKITDFFLDISQDVFCDIIREKLKQFSKIIIESLNSMFIKKENLALYTILKAAGSTKHIHVILLSFTLNNYLNKEKARMVRETQENAIETGKPKDTTENNDVIEKVKKKLDKKSTKSSKIEKVKKKLDKKSTISSKASKKNKTDSAKLTSKKISKQLKTELETYEKLETEIIYICQYWDKQSQTLKKTFFEKGINQNYETPKELHKSTKGSSRKVSSTALNSSLKLSELGIYFWIILNSNRDRKIDFVSQIKNSLLNFSSLQNVLTEIKKQTAGIFEESEILFSIISKTQSRKNIHSNVFDLKDFYGDNGSMKDETTSVSTNASKKKSETSIIVSNQKSKRKLSRNSRRTSGDIFAMIPSNNFETKDQLESKFTTKYILAPNEEFKYQVLFSPLKFGTYNHMYFIETVLTNTRYSINCHAECDIPKIDLNPEIIFPKYVKYLKDKIINDNFIYVEETNEFDFGAVVVFPNAEKSLTYTTRICLKNTTGFVCEIKLLLDNAVFECEPKTLVLEPYVSKYVIIKTKPTKIGKCTSQMFVSVKNNPKVLNFTLSCTPCKLEFSISPKSINFDKIPVGKITRRTLKLSNASAMNLRWKFLEPSVITEIFNVSEVEGVINSYSVSHVTFEFFPQKEQLIGKRLVHFEVSDIDMSTNDRFCTEQIVLSGESVEYNVEVKDHIDYGEVQGGMEHKKLISLVNKGKCETRIHIDLNEKVPPQHSSFKVDLSDMTLGPLETNYVKLLFYPTQKVTIKHFPVFSIRVMDAGDETCVNVYKMTVSADVFMPRFSINPPQSLQFGHVLVSNTKENLIQITNRGKFPFNFVIISYKKYLADLEKGKQKKSKSKKETKSLKQSEEKKSKKSNASKSTKSKSKSTKSQKDKKEKQISKSSKSENKSIKDKKSKNSGTESLKTKAGRKTEKPKKIKRLDLGCFSIIPSSGTVKPGETFKSSVKFRPLENQAYKDEILVNILEISDLKKKKILTLEGIGCEPKLNFDDFDSIFVESFITKSLDTYNKPKNIEAYTVFESTQSTVYFELVCLNTKKSVGIHIKNIGYVSANLNAKMESSFNDIFDVFPRSIQVEPNSSCCFVLSFTPKTLNEVKAILELQYNVSTNQKLSITLTGKGYCPQIAMITPITTNHEAMIKMLPICIGEVGQEELKFKNIGVITSRVILELLGNEFQALRLLPSPDTLDMVISKEEDAEYVKPNLMIVIKPCEEASFFIRYQSNIEQVTNAYVNILTINNPLETFKISIVAETFYNDVVFTNLLRFKHDSRDRSNSSLIPTNSIGYFLDFGFAELNKLYKKSFFIENISKDSVYKFRFYTDFVVFIPEVGHLKPGTKKEILVSFKATEPVLKQKEEIHCNICKIQYVNPSDQSSDLSWDDRQKFILWTNACLPVGNQQDFNEIRSRNSDASFKFQEKLIMEGVEPEIISISNSIEHVSILLSVIADYSNYKCDTFLIEMPDTYIKEKSCSTFTVENTGTVPFEVRWIITCQKPSIAIRRSNSLASLVETPSEHASRTLQSSCSCSSLCTTPKSLCEDPPLALTITPNQIQIIPQEKQSFQVEFSPETENLYEFQVDSEISSLSPFMVPIRIQMNGRGLKVPFYFETENGHAIGKDENLQFESVGPGTESNCTCYVVNLGDSDLTFKVDPDPTESKPGFSYFSCQTAQDKVGPKKKTAIILSFIPHILGRFTENYIIKMAETDITQTLTLEGLCREAKMYFSEPSILLNSTVPKVKISKTVSFINEENFSVKFRFSKKTLCAEGNQEEAIDITPMSGKVLPQSNLDLKISFCPKSCGIHIFNAKCVVDRIRKHLNLHVTAESRKIEASVTYIDKKGQTIELEEDKANVIDFENIIKGQKIKYDLKIINKGETGLYYSFEYDPQPIGHRFELTLSNKKGFLKIGENVVVSLYLKALRLGALKQFKIKLDISYGSSYQFYLNAVSVQNSSNKQLITSKTDNLI